MAGFYTHDSLITQKATCTLLVSIQVRSPILVLVVFTLDNALILSFTGISVQHLVVIVWICMLLCIPLYEVQREQKGNPFYNLHVYMNVDVKYKVQVCFRLLS